MHDGIIDNYNFNLFIYIPDVVFVLYSCVIVLFQMLNFNYCFNCLLITVYLSTVELSTDNGQHMNTFIILMLTLIVIKIAIGSQNNK